MTKLSGADGAVPRLVSEMVAPVEVPVLKHSCWRPAADARWLETQSPGPPSLVTPRLDSALSVAPPGSPIAPDVTQ